MASPNSLHIAMLPWFAMEHITSFLQLSNKLAQRGHKISLFIPKNTQPTLQHLNHHPNLITFVQISVPSSNVSLLMTPMDLFDKDIEVLLLDLNPNIVFFDLAYWMPTPRLTHCLRIKSLLYSVISPSSLASYDLSYPLRISKGCSNITEYDPILHAHKAKVLAGFGNFEFGKGAIEGWTTALVQSYARGMDGAYVDYFPTSALLAGSVIPEAIASNKDENWAKWLGGFEAGSVVYCALGSECRLEPYQFQELLLGLELSGMPFLAALKPPKGFECVESAFPQGFKERVEGRGFVYGGCVPQQFILQHPSVGCFITHGGSGPLSEALVNKCQLMLLPNHGEMVVNARVIGNILKVGVEVEKLKIIIKMACLPKRAYAKL
ncbi:hypothetical protein VNO77_43093 [Canavalia gladiata]|uniref:Uncharacterized protein n=1 Tax=Canavalia gladiata TaxID=3824 RepID=A0AAN9PPM6_CANGL